MIYAEARDLLRRLPSLEVKPGLERTLTLLDGLGHPERHVTAIHVAGTNGKGSVVAMLDAILHAAGYRTGRYTSPELVDYRDRIVVDGRWISERDFAGLVERLAPLLSERTDPPTEFEALTAIALRLFADRQVDVAVVETGLGGRYDATNTVSPLLTILTNVDLDHTLLLGSTEAEIAWEKAGIAKCGVPLVTGPLSPEVLHVVRAECARVDAPVVDSTVLGIERCSKTEDEPPARFRADGADIANPVELPLLGLYQQDNLRTVLVAVRLLRERGLDIPSAAVRDGLRTVSWPGRLERISRRPDIVLEGAHNVAGIRALVQDVKRLAPDPEKRSLLFGVLRDKDVSTMIQELFPSFSRVWLTQSASPRALPAHELATRSEALTVPVAWYDSVAKALAAALEPLGEDDVLVVAGSLTVVAEARKLMERR